MRPSVLLIGMDGAPWKLLRPWIEEGRLPALKALMQEGSHGNLKGIMPLESGSAWVTMCSGKNPGKHGVYGFISESGKLINSGHVRTRRLWNILSERGLRSAIINIPVTYPIEEIDGCMVSCFLTPPDAKDFFYPSSLGELLEKTEYKIDIKHDKYAFIADTTHFREKRGSYLEELYDIMERRCAVLKSLMEGPWDLFMINFKECDTLQHYFWDEPNTMAEFFEKLDRHIGELVRIYREKNPGAHLFVVSDHGFDASPTRAFNIGAWLRSIGKIRDERTLLQKTVPIAYALARKIPFSPLLFKSERVQQLRELFQRKSIETSKIYFRQFGIHIPSTDSSLYEQEREHIIGLLKGMKDPRTGQEVFQIVGKREEFYSGPFWKGAPDIITLPHPHHDIIFTSNEREIFKDINIPIPGKHFASLNGIVLIHGEKIRHETLEGASIMDICPTILHILGVPIPRDTDGKVLTQAFCEDSAYAASAPLMETDDDASTSAEKERIQSAIKGIRF